MVGEPLCGVGRLNPNNFTQGHVMKKEWLVTDVTAICPPDRAERAIFGVILAGQFFGQFRNVVLSGSHFLMQEPPLEP